MILDGETIVQDERGISDFAALRVAMGSEPHRLVFYAFDLLHIDGRDFRLAPLTERRAALQELLGEASPTSALQFSQAVADEGAKVFAAATGLVSKVLSPSASRPLQERLLGRLAEDEVHDGGEVHCGRAWGEPGRTDRLSPCWRARPSKASLTPAAPS